MKDDRPESLPAEEEALERAMTSIDPLLRASLQREQKRRRARWLLAGGFAVFIITITWILATAIPLSPEKAAERKSDDAARQTRPADPIAQASAAADAAREGWRLWQAGDGLGAEQKFEQATQLDAGDANHWNGLGWSRMQQQDFQGAWEAFQRCLKIDAKHPAGLNGAGQAQLSLGRYPAAERYLTQAAPRAPAARFGLARVQLLQGKYAAAARSLGQLRADEAGELDQALLRQMREAAQAKQMSPELKARLEPPRSTARTAQDTDAPSEIDPVAMNAQGWRLLQSGKPRPAELAFRAALEAEPDMAAAMNGLGFSLLNQNKGAEAKPIFEALVKTQAKHAGFVNGLARSYELTGDADKAIELWRSVDRAGGPVTACTWGLARVLTETGKHKEAIPLWERIVKAQPDDASAREMLKRCREAASG